MKRTMKITRDLFPVISRLCSLLLLHAQRESGETAREERRIVREMSPSSSLPCWWSRKRIANERCSRHTPDINALLLPLYEHSPFMQHILRWRLYCDDLAGSKTHEDLFGANGEHIRVGRETAESSTKKVCHVGKVLVKRKHKSRVVRLCELARRRRE